jgi:L-ascorbate metabolism protein UlaG (beta-lactamase superfamily)
MNRNERVYLKRNIKVEPLIDNWYAWSHLIPPANAARNLTERHLKIMDSYISAPQAHAAAVKNPKMSGGPFIDYGGREVDAIKLLRDETVRKRENLIELSGGLHTLDGMLRAEAKGYSLQSLYCKIPPALKGYVELVYDLNNNPSFRLVEQLLYNSSYYCRDAQSLMLSAVKDDDRPFVLSTPRLAWANDVKLEIPFEDHFVDDMFQMKLCPQRIDAVLERANVPEKALCLEGMFTTDPPLAYAPYVGRGVRWRYFGHACILIEISGTAILLDPVLSYTYDSQISRYTYEDLPPHIDFVLITHNHQDHILFETLLQLRHKIGSIVIPRSAGGTLQDPSLRLILKNVGFPHVTELGELETLRGDGFEIVGVPFFGEHADLDIRTKLGYLIRSASHSMLFAADSCNIDSCLYANISRDLGSIDVLFLGMECDGAPLSWLYGPLLMKPIDRSADQSRRLAGSDYEQAIDMVERFKCKEVYVYAMGQEPWLNYIMSIKYTEQSRPILESNKLIEECRSRGIIAERLFGEKEILTAPVD